jgi:hypothetical protein
MDADRQRERFLGISLVIKKLLLIEQRLVISRKLFWRDASMPLFAR